MERNPVCGMTVDPAKAAAPVSTPARLIIFAPRDAPRVSRRIRRDFWLSLRLPLVILQPGMWLWRLGGILL